MLSFIYSMYSIWTITATKRGEAWLANLMSLALTAGLLYKFQGMSTRHGLVGVNLHPFD